jgi:hypothetical protein
LIGAVEAGEADADAEAPPAEEVPPDGVPPPELELPHADKAAVPRAKIDTNARLRRRKYDRSKGFVARIPFLLTLLEHRA